MEDAEALVLVDVNTRFRKLQEARALLRINELGQETEREKLRVISNRYSQKAVLLDDVLEAQAAVAQSAHQYRQALATFWTVKADFERAVGGDQ